MHAIASPPCRVPASREIPFGAVTSITDRGQSVFLTGRPRPLSLSAGKFPILMVPAGEQNIMQDRLLRFCRLGKGTIARAFRKPEKGGYIWRIVDLENRGAVRLFLPGKGKGVMPVLQELGREWEERAGSGHAMHSRAIVQDARECPDAIV